MGVLNSMFNGSIKPKMNFQRYPLNEAKVGFKPLTALLFLRPNPLLTGGYNGLIIPYL